MPVGRPRPLVPALVALALAFPTMPAAGARPERTVDVGIRHVDPKMRPRLATRKMQRTVRQVRRERGRLVRQATVGEEKLWLALDDALGILYLKNYELRGVGEHIEVWVASDEDEVSSGTDFPAGDCRNDPYTLPDGTVVKRTEITDQLVRYLISEFDGNIYPKESAAFSVPPERDGTDAPLAGIAGLPADYFAGDGDDIVVLVDNVRDDNFYDTDNQHSLSYIAGFYASFFDDLTNRLVMTIDAWDWIHRTTARPPHQPTTDPCTSAPARPFLYEGVFAHEYQHLLENYVDPNETIWVNEGLSDWAQTLTGYVDPSVPIDQLGFDSHIQCFLGYLGVATEFNPIPRPGGPEQSLNLWGDQTDFESEILCDYGAAYTMMELLAHRFGLRFMRALHLDERQGFESLAALLEERGGPGVNDLIRKWASTVALDGVLDDGAVLARNPDRNRQVDTLHATINWDTDQTYSSPGAPPNGSDFVRLRDGTGAYLSAGEVRSLAFDGVTELPSLPIEWVVDEDPPAQPGDPALYAGTGDNLDRAIVREVTVPTTHPTLAFDGIWSLEEGFDYAYVQVSTDGGETYQSIACSDQVEGGGPLGPAFNGESGGVVPVTCDLSAYAGQTIVLAFRMVTDSSIHFDGFWVDDVSVDGAVLSDGSTLEGWLSPTQFNPIDVEGYTVQLVAYTPGGKRAWLARLPLDRRFDGAIAGGKVRRRIGSSAEIVAAIVTYHDSTETVQQYAPYTLTVNGVVQPGGG